jgi:hypothetical protein
MNTLWMQLSLTTATAVGLLGLLVTPASAQESPVMSTAPPAPEAPQGAPPQPFHRYFLHESFGVNVVTYTGASGKAPASTITPADKVVQFQQIGFGYWVDPHIRLQLTGMLGETVSGLKPGQSSFTLAALIPCVLYTNGGFFGGGGPIFAPRAFGADGFNVGVFSVAGYAFPLGRGVTLAGAVQVPVFLAQKDSVAVTPALILGERF